MAETRVRGEAEAAASTAAPHGGTAEAVRHARTLRAARVALAAGMLVLVTKLIAWLLTGSTAILADALESIVNVLASALSLWSVWYASRPPDREHPYGHGRAEFLSGGIEGAMLAVAGVLAIVQGGERLWHGTSEVAALGTGTVLLAATGVVNLGVAIYLLWTARRTESVALEADGKHLIGDLVTTLGVLAALGIVQATGWKWVDSVAAVVVGCILAAVGARVAFRSLSRLMDSQDKSDDAAIRAVLALHEGPAAKAPAICSFEKVRHRHDGASHWIDMHIRVPAALSVAEGHAIASTIEYEVVRAVGGVGKATAHIEPCEDPACPRCRARRS